MSQLMNILASNLSRRGVDLDSRQTSACVEAMYEYALIQVDRYRRRELFETLGLSMRLYPRVLCHSLILWIRKQFFLIACRQAQLRADTEGYKIYVILSSAIGYTLISSREVDYNKKIKVLEKNLTAKELSSKSAFIAYSKTYYGRKNTAR